MQRLAQRPQACFVPAPRTIPRESAIIARSIDIFLILEMGRPFEGLMQISSAPLRNALQPLAAPAR